MRIITRNIRQISYNCLFFFFGSILTLSLIQIENNCAIDKLKDENYKHYKASKLQNSSLIILIISSPNNIDRRAIIRETWLKLKDNKQLEIKHYFVIGSVGLSTDMMLHLSTEQSKYDDLLILPIEDKYNTLTNKVLQSFVWLNEQITYGLNYSHVLKCDDDSFIRIDILKNEILQSKNDVDYFLNNPDIFSVNLQSNGRVENKYLYWGYFNGNAKIKSRGKWLEKEWILCDNYLPYALGGGYILSKGLVTYLAKNAEYLRLYNSEDVSLGTWLAPLTNIIRIHDIRFDTEWNSRGCQNLYLVYHKITPIEMKMMYTNIKSDSKPCIKETLRRQHYLYSWTEPPSKCCSKK